MQMCCKINWEREKAQKGKLYKNSQNNFFLIQNDQFPQNAKD